MSIRRPGFLRTATAQEAETTLRGRTIRRLRRMRDGALVIARSPVTAARRVVAALRGRALAALRELGLSRPRAALALVRLGRSLSPRSPFLTGAERLLRARADGWTPAVAAAAAPPEAAAALLASPSPTPPSRLATPVARGGDAARETGRVVVCTARFGEAPRLQVIHGLPERISLLCFTDRPEEAEGWRCVEMAADPLTFARCKILTAEALRDAAAETAASLWLDPDRLIVGDLESFLQRWAAPQDFMLWRHEASVDWSDLAERSLVRGAAPADAVVAQAAGCAAEALPRGAGCFDTGVLWRRHGAPGIDALMRRWFETERAAPGVDGLSLLRALHAEGGRPPAIAPLSLGPAGDNLFFARSARRPVTAPRAKALATETQLATQTSPAAPGVRRARVPLTFIYGTYWPNSATTLLRGKQLSEIVSAHLGDLYDVTYTSDLDGVRDQVVMATKEVLLVTKPPVLAALKARNAALLGSWEDAIPDPVKTPLLDAMMTLSFRAALDMERLWPGVPAFHVTHNVNQAVPHVSPPVDRLRTAYFGYLPNTVRPASLAQEVDMVNADSIGLLAKGISTDWIDALPHYNCHWIVRNSLPTDGWKPFLKGFVAARCGSPVIVTRDDPTAGYYLSEDYPFYADSLRAADLEAAWVKTAAAFGGPDWRMAQDIMRRVASRSTDAQVAADFRAMMEAVLT